MPVLSRSRLRLGAVALAAALPLSLAVAGPAWASSTANEIVYTVDANDDGAYALVTQDLESRRVTTVLPADPDLAFTYDDPELSPDGTRIALASDYLGARTTPPTGAPGIIVVNRDGSGYRRLSTPPSTNGTNPSDSIDISPSWSPDGSTLLFTRVTQDSAGAVTSALFTVPAGGGAIAPVPGADGGFTADWNPTNGNQLVYAALASGGNGVGPLTVINSDGTGKRTLGPTGALPAWSPDGQTIAYATVTDASATAGDVAQIATVPAAGGTANVFASTRPSPSVRSVAEYPSWSPDGESLLYDFYSYDGNGLEQPGDLWGVDRFGVRAGKLLGGNGDEAQVHQHGPAPTAGRRRRGLAVHARGSAAHPRHPRGRRRTQGQGRRADPARAQGDRAVDQRRPGPEPTRPR